MNAVIPLHVKIRDSIARGRFGVIDGLAVEILVEPSYIDRFIRYIFPLERRNVPV